MCRILDYGKWRYQQQKKEDKSRALADGKITDLQKAAEEQLQNSVTKRGVIVVMDPNNGELLALASYPTFDPNVFSRIGTKENIAMADVTSLA